MTQIKSQLMASFAMKDLGDLGCVLGLQVVRTRSPPSLHLHQAAYIKRVVDYMGLMRQSSR